MELNDDYSTLIYLAGSLYSRVRDLNAMLGRMAESGQCQGEIHLAHRAIDGAETQLMIHIDGTDFTLMPDDSEHGFRLDISGHSITLS